MDHWISVPLPDIGEGVAEGEVVRWLKKVGDAVKLDEPVVLVMTDKATVELPSPYSGVLAARYFDVGDLVPCHTPLYAIDPGVGTTVAPSLSAKAPSSLVPTCQKAASEKNAVPTGRESQSPTELQAAVLTEKGSLLGEAAATDSSQPLALPRTRQLAHQLGISLSTIPGTGPQGMVTDEDLSNHLKNKHHVTKSSGHTAPEPIHIDPENEASRQLLTGLRRLMAKKMATSKREIPHFSYFETVDVEKLLLLKSQLQENSAKAGGERIGLTPLLSYALSHSLKAHPEVHCCYDPASGECITYHNVNLGLAFASEEGLLVAVLRASDQLSLKETIAAYDLLRSKVQSGTLSRSETTGSTFTLSNFGSVSRRGLWATPVIHHPESGILAVSYTHDLPTVKDGLLRSSKAIYLSWSFDHRIIDGASASRFSNTFCTMVEECSNWPIS